MKYFGRKVFEQCTNSMQGVNPLDQCCHIWQFVTNLATFDTNWLPIFCFGYLALVATFKNWQKLVLDKFKTGFRSISFFFFFFLNFATSYSRSLFLFGIFQCYMFLYIWCYEFVADINNLYFFFPSFITRWRRPFNQTFIYIYI